MGLWRTFRRWRAGKLPREGDEIRIPARTCVWTGVKDGNWDDPDNWLVYDKDGAELDLNSLEIEDKKMSDTSWIKPGMYVTVDRGLRLRYGVHDRSHVGDVFEVQAVDYPHVAVVALTGFRTMASCLGKVFTLNADEVGFRELSPAYVEAMTGKKRPANQSALAELYSDLYEALLGADAELTTLNDKLAKAERSLADNCLRIVQQNRIIEEMTARLATIRKEVGQW